MDKDLLLELLCSACQDENSGYENSCEKDEKIWLSQKGLCFQKD